MAELKLSDVKWYNLFDSKLQLRPRVSCVSREYINGWLLYIDGLDGLYLLIPLEDVVK